MGNPGASNMFTIYCHTLDSDGRRYVGQTKRTWRQRWDQHVSQAKSEKFKYSRNHFYNAVKKYGRDAFSHVVLMQVETLDEANAWEEFWVEFFDTCNPTHGFNLTKGGSHTPHPVKNPWDRPEFRAVNAGRNVAHLHTPAARAKQKASLTPEKRSASTKKAQARPDVRARQAELHADPEYLRRISESTSASLADPAVKARMSAATRALHGDPAYRAKISASIRAAMADPGVKERHRAAVTEAQNRPEVLAKHRARRASDETRAKIAASSLGRTHTADSKARQRELYLARSRSCGFCGSAIDGKRSAVRGRVSCSGCYVLHRAGHVSFLRPDRSFVRPTVYCPT